VFWDRHKNKVFAALLLALFAVAAWGGFRIYTERRDAAAASLLAAAKSAPDFQKIVAQYPGTPAGASACLFLAEEQKKEKKFTEANATLQSFLDKNPKHELRGFARMAMAANLEALGKPDEALTAYQRLATDDPEGFTAPIAMISQVHILKEKKQTDEARRICETILTKYRDSLVANEAQRQLRLLKGGEPATPPSAAADTMVPPAMSVAPAAPPAAAPAAPPAAAPPAGNSPKPAASPKR
jgi:predicted negative regulator of RcsB-dependent stress response